MQKFTLPIRNSLQAIMSTGKTLQIAQLTAGGNYCLHVLEYNRDRAHEIIKPFNLFWF